jgi:hypothetical protein
MSNDTDIQSDHPLRQVISPAIDALTVLAYLYLLPWLIVSFQTPSPVNGLVIGGAFFFLLLAIYAIRWLAAEPEREPVRVSRRREPGARRHSDERGCGWQLFFYMAVPLVYCAFLSFILLATTTSFLEDSGPWDNLGMWLMLGGALLIGVALIFPTLSRPGRGDALGLWLHAISVLGVALVTLIGIGFWESLKAAAPIEGTEQFRGIWKLIMFALIYLVFVMFLGPPRLYLHAIRGDRWGVLTHLISIGYFTWEMLDY